MSLGYSSNVSEPFMGKVCQNFTLRFSAELSQEQVFTELVD